MKIASLNKTGSQRIAQLNKYLKENHGVKVTGFHSKSKLEQVRETAHKHVVRIRNSNKKFNLDPEYAKFLGVRDMIDTMLEEGVYAESPAMQKMKKSVEETVKKLMDSGYTMDEACGECMNRFRQDSRFAYDDEFVLPIVLKAAKDYMEECGSGSMYDSAEIQTDLSDRLLAELAKECDVELVDTSSYDTIEEKLNSFAEVSGKTRESVVSFLNGLDDDALPKGIQMFGRKIGEANAFVKARKDAISSGKKEFEVDGKKYKVTGDTSNEKEETNESMFDDIIAELITEEVEVEQAEVVMALRSLSDDIQDQIERIGRMMNEDLPAIADQMTAEFGADQAMSVKSSLEQTLQGVLDAAKAGKDGVDASVGQLTGTGSPMVDPAMADAGMEEPGMEEPVDNVPAASGPEEEPLGRAPIEEPGV